MGKSIKSYFQMVLSLCCVCVVILGFPGTGGAQIFLEKAYPAPESTSEESPEHIQVEFSETIPTALARLRLENEQGEIIEAKTWGKGEGIGNRKQDSKRNKQFKLTLDIPELDHGTYYVHWGIMDTDAQVFDGVFRFTIADDNVSGSSAGELFYQAIQAEESDRSSLGLGLRMVKLLVMMGVAGWVIFHYFLWSKEGDHNITWNKKGKLIAERILYLTAGVLFILADGLHLLTNVARLTEGNWLDKDAWRVAGTLLFSSIYGLLACIRLVIPMLLFGLTFRNGSRTYNGLKLVLVLVLVLTFALTQNAYLSNVFVSHAIHLLLIVFWFAGLLGFTLYSFWMKADTLGLTYIHQRLSVFSKLSIYLLFFAIGSGILLSFGYTGSWDKLVSSNYGELLFWKLLVFSPVLVIAALHRWIWWPALKKVQDQAQEKQGIYSLIWGLRLELILAVAVTILSGALSQTPPPKDVQHMGHHQNIQVYLDTVTTKGTQEVIFNAYVLKDRKRLEGAEVTFDVWDKKQESLFIDVQEYCNANNMRMDLFKDVLVERGFIKSTPGQEMEDHTYQGVFQLDQNVWNVSIQVQHDKLGIIKNQDFKLDLHD